METMESGLGKMNLKKRKRREKLVKQKLSNRREFLRKQHKKQEQEEERSRQVRAQAAELRKLVDVPSQDVIDKFSNNKNLIKLKELPSIGFNKAKWSIK